MLRAAHRLPPHWEIDYEDIGNVERRPRIQSCNACVSTSMALCVWPCNCYEKGSRSEPDLMWELDLYARLDLADAWAIIGPVNWYGPSSNLKLMFDRWRYVEFGHGRKYSDNQAEHLAEAGVFDRLDEWLDAFSRFVEAKGKVPPGRYRAFGHRPPSHRWADLKLYWRALRLGLGRAPRGSSPRRQHDLGLDDDATPRPGRGEGEKLRE
jgi:hypothetical protein